jgi:hypothetical protein
MNKGDKSNIKKEDNSNIKKGDNSLSPFFILELSLF